MTGLSFSDCDVIQLCIFGVSPGWLPAPQDLTGYNGETQC